MITLLPFIILLCPFVVAWFCPCFYVSPLLQCPKNGRGKCSANLFALGAWRGECFLLANKISLVFSPPIVCTWGRVLLPRVQSLERSLTDFTFAGYYCSVVIDCFVL